MLKKEDTKLPQKHGGMGMTDLTKFQQSFKFSWFRRILSTNAVWPKILETIQEKSSKTALFMENASFEKIDNGKNTVYPNSISTYTLAYMYGINSTFK